jgi:phosphocarrier protein FPr
VELRNLTAGSTWVSAASLSRVATLGALHGHEVQARAGGPQAKEALAALLTLAADAFGEAAGAGPPVPAAPAQPSATSAPAGPIGAAPGIGIGPARPAARSDELTVPDAASTDPDADWQAVQGAIAGARGQIQEIRDRAAREVGTDEAAIFDAHLLLLDDRDLLDDVRRRICSGQAAAPAWAAAVSAVADELAALPEPYLQARAADVRAVGAQVLRGLLGVPAGGIGQPGQTGVVIAHDLTPAEAAQLDRARVAAVVLAAGSPTSHSAILARARGIPTVVAAGAAVLAIPAGTQVAVDGGTGEVVVAPPPDVLASFEARAAALADRGRQALAQATTAAVTADGQSILVGANVGSVADAAAAADLAGLVRTEFLFLGRTQPPDVAEQEAIYRGIAEALGGRRITLRTLDVGGDKPLDYLPMPREANPFLGVRGIRLSLRRPELLTDQLVAVVRVAHETPVSLMFPMVSTVDELLAARRLLDDAIAKVGRSIPAELQVGIMVEVPAAALNAAAFVPYVDFFSIGTNDLTQYVLAAERGNDSVAAFADPFDPSVLRLIGMICQAAGDDVLVAVCGELAADERATGLLVGLGVRELSVAPPAVPAIKEAVRTLSARDAAELARAALAARTGAGVRSLVTEVPA